jgi:hypothetical protein
MKSLFQKVKVSIGIGNLFQLSKSFQSVILTTWTQVCQVFERYGNGDQRTTCTSRVIKIQFLPSPFILIADSERRQRTDQPTAAKAALSLSNKLVFKFEVKISPHLSMSG